MLSQVFTVLKPDSRKEDFFALVQKKTAWFIKLNNEEVKTFSNEAWQKCIKLSSFLNESVFKSLVTKNSYLENTNNLFLMS